MLSLSLTRARAVVRLTARISRARIDGKTAVTARSGRLAREFKPFSNGRPQISL